MTEGCTASESGTGQTFLAPVTDRLEYTKMTIAKKRKKRYNCQVKLTKTL